jgi:hypothetical protein
MAVTWNAENSAHLLSRAGFGGDIKEVEKYAKLPQSIAVDLLVRAKGSNSRGPGKSGLDATDAEDRQDLKAWWAKRMVKAKTKRVQEKMCLFWHDHFASSVSVVKNNYYMAKQNALFRFYGFGSFHTLVFEVTRDPAMLEFLDLKLSTKNKPNENYGRELMELFALGVKDMNGVDNYTQDDVEQITKALTGWQIINDAALSPTRATITATRRSSPASRISRARRPRRRRRGEHAAAAGDERHRRPARAPRHRRPAHDAAVHRQEALGVVRVQEPVEDARRRDHGGLHREPDRRSEGLRHPRPPPLDLHARRVLQRAGEDLVGEEPVRVRVPRDPRDEEQDERQGAARPPGSDGHGSLRSARRERVEPRAALDGERPLPRAHQVRAGARRRPHERSEAHADEGDRPNATNAPT